MQLTYFNISKHFVECKSIGGRCYYANPTLVDQESAALHCQEITGGHLVEISDADQNGFIIDYLYSIGKCSKIVFCFFYFML